MEDQSKQALKKNTIVSLFSLFFQSGYSAVLGLIANFILTVVLTRAVFGIYTLTLSIMAFFSYFSDIGLAASLVQKKEVTDEDLKTTFTIQQLLVITLITIGYFITPLIQSNYKLPTEAISLYHTLLLCFFLSSLKTIPSILLERNVKFKKIVLVQIVENTIFYITVSVLALAGFGLYSFIYAFLFRSVVGVIFMYYLSFWMPRFGISKSSLNTLLSFGIPFQTNSFLALIKDDLLIVYLGSVLGVETLGLIGWAKRWAEAPIRIIMDNVNKILFPVFSRIQNEKEHVGKIMEKILYFQTLILAPIYIGMILLMHYVVALVPKYSKWEPALPIFYIFCISTFLVLYSSPFINLFYGLKKVGTALKFMIYWTVMTWILVPVLTNIYGMYGFPVVHLFLSLTCIAVVIVAKKIIPFNFFQSISSPIIAALGMGIIVYGIQRFGVSVPIFIAAALIGASTYGAILYVVFKKNVLQDIRSIFKFE